MNSYLEVLKTQLSFLFFKQVKPNLEKYQKEYLVMVLSFTALAGMGRYWDNPRAHWWQLIGLGSLMYLFIMTFFLWAIIYPLRPQNWSYRNVLIFVGMTSPPAILYAIPVEKFMSMKEAQSINVYFLGIVALWRMVLLFRYLSHSAKLSSIYILVAGSLPIVLIVAGLTFLNLEHVVFSIMGGLRPEDVSGNDGTYFVLLLITYSSLFVAPILLLIYGVLCVTRSNNKN